MRQGLLQPSHGSSAAHRHLNTAPAAASRQPWRSRGACLLGCVSVEPRPTVSVGLEAPQAPGPLTAAFVRVLRQHTAAPGTHPAANRGPANHTQWLLQCADQLAPQLQPHQASLVLYVCAKCRLPCTQQLLHGLLQQLQPSKLQQLPPAGLVNTAWALAVLRVDPGQPWMEAFYSVVGSSLEADRSAQLQHTGDSTSTASSSAHAGASSTNSNSRSSSSAYNRHQLVQLLWAVASLRQRPPAAWLQDLLGALQQQLPLLSASELTNVIWALAQVGFRPGRQWLGAWFLASRHVLPLCHPDTLACQAASLGVLRVALDSGRWLVAFRAATLQQLQSLQPQHVASIFCGLAKRRNPVPPHWVRLLLLHQLQRMDEGADGSSSSGGGAVEPSARNVAATVWALPALLYPTAVEWAAQQENAALLKRLAAASLPLLRQCSVGELVQLAVGFARLGYYPGAHWLKSHENAVAQHKLALTDVNRQRLQVAARQLWKDG